MRQQAAEDVLAVLPDRFHHHQGSARRELAEHLQSVFLAIDEAVFFLGVEGVAALDLAAFAPDGRHDRLLDALLRRPAPLVG
jgi:hypothetical protein